jgi:hypothetical protein
MKSGVLTLLPGATVVLRAGDRDRLQGTAQELPFVPPNVTQADPNIKWNIKLHVHGNITYLPTANSLHIKSL